MLLFPCVCTFTESGAISSPVKVDVHPGSVDVWIWNSADGRAEIIGHGPLLVADKTNGNVWTLVCDDGTPCRIVLDPKSCGCSHPLKRFRPSAPTRDYAPG